MMIDAIDQLLTSQVSLTLARILLCSYYIFSGVLAIKMWDAFVAGMPAKSLGAKKILNAAVIITNLGGSFLLISNIRGLAWLGAGWLGIFTLLSIPLGHPFWKFEEPQRTMERWWAVASLALAGAMGIAAINGW
jgi:transmembrane protein